MCDPVSAALMVAAAGTQAYNTHKTASKKDRAAAQGIRRQGEIQRDANNRLNETLQKFEDSESAPIVQEKSDQFRQQLRLKQALALAGLEQEGASSDAATQAAHKAGATAVDYGDFLEGVFARIDAPGEQRRREGEERSELGSDLSVSRRKSKGEDFLTQLKISSIQRNPWLDLLAAGMQGAGTGMAMGGGGGMFGGGAPMTTVPGSTLPPSAFYTQSGNALPGQLYGLGP